MNTESAPFIVYVSDELDFDNEIILPSSENDSQSFVVSEIPNIDESGVKLYCSIAKSFVEEGKYDEFDELVKKLENEGKIHRMLEDKNFFILYSKYRIHYGYYQEIINILENVQNTCDPVFTELWDEAHYRKYFMYYVRPLTAVQKFRIRRRHPPPPGICQGGVRPPLRLAESSVSVLRKWYTMHSARPYPCKRAKLILAKRAGMTVKQVDNWFSNARRKHKRGIQQINRPDDITTMINDKPYSAINRKGIDLVEKAVCTDAHSKTEAEDTGDIDLQDLLMSQKNNTWSVQTGPIATSENAGQITFSDTFSNDENLCLPDIDSVHAPVCTVHKKIELCSFGEDVTASLRVPFSEINFRDDICHQYRQHYSENLIDNIAMKDVTKPYTEVDHITVYKQLCFNVNNVTPTTTVHVRRNQTKGQVKENCENENAGNRQGKQATAKVEGKMFQQIRPKRKNDENQTITRVKDMQSVWKLRVQLTKRRQYQKRKKEQKDPKHLDVNMASQCIKSLQKLCQDVTHFVKSPVDFAYTADFGECSNRWDDEMCVDKQSTIINKGNGLSLVKDTDSTTKNMSEKVECADLALGCKQRKRETKSSTENIASPSCIPSELWNNRAQLSDSMMFETGPDLNSSRNQCVTNIRPGVLTYSEQPMQFLQKDEMVPSSLHGFTSCHQYVSDTNQCCRFQGSDMENIWQSGCCANNPSVMTRPLLGTNYVENCHCTTCRGINTSGYGTVVGEAIQGLLNLSSSQESS